MRSGIFLGRPQSRACPSLCLVRAALGQGHAPVRGGPFRALSPLFVTLNQAAGGWRGRAPARPRQAARREAALPTAHSHRAVRRHRLRKEALPGTGQAAAPPGCGSSPAPDRGRAACLPGSEQGGLLPSGLPGPRPLLTGVRVVGNPFQSHCWGLRGMRIPSPGRGMRRAVLGSERPAGPSAGRLCVSPEIVFGPSQGNKS